MTQIYDRVALIGLGLIASSMFHAIKRAGLAGEVVGYARSPETREIARDIGLCDRVFDSAREAVEGADLVVLCVPVGAMEQVAIDIAPALKAGATVSDVGSVKRAVIDAVARHLPQGVHFVPAHPLAGTDLGLCGIVRRPLVHYCARPVLGSRGHRAVGKPVARHGVECRPDGCGPP